MEADEFFNYRYRIHATPIITEILEFLVNFDELSGKSGFDAGCGWGWFLRFADAKDIDIVGSDMDPAPLRKALLFGIRKDRLVISDVQFLPFKDEVFEFVFCWHVLEHVPDHQKAVWEIHRVLKSGSLLLLGVPNDQTVTNLIFSPLRWLKRKGVEHFLIKKLAFYEPTHLREYNHLVLLELLKGGFHVVGVRFDFLTLPVIRLLKLFRLRPPKTETLIKTGRRLPFQFTRSIEVCAVKK